MKPRILQTVSLSPQLDAALAADFDVSPLWQRNDATAFLAAEGATFAGLVTSAPFGASAALIDALPALKVIACRGVGMDRIDLDRACARGIQVCGTFGVLTDCVADLAMGLLIDATREISAADRFVRAGHWLRGKYPLTRRVSGKRLGIVGLGGIGRAIATRAAGFGMAIRYHNRRRAEDMPYAYVESVEALAEWADFLVVAVAASAATQGLISARVLDALGAEGFLVNISRGSVVDEPALVRALAERRIAGAALDVFADEPAVPAALLALDNVVLSPHMASGTVETRAAMEKLVLDNLTAFFATGEVLTPAY